MFTIKGVDGMKKRMTWLLTMILLLTGCGGEKQTYSVTAGEPEPLVKTVKMAVVGDIMVHDYQYNEAYDPSTGEYDFMHNFQDAKKYFADDKYVLSIIKP